MIDIPGGDQGLLNSYFTDWLTNSDKRLSYGYNVVSSTFYSYLPAYNYYRHTVKVLHYIGPRKPWHRSRNHLKQVVADSSDSPLSFELVMHWWRVFERYQHFWVRDGILASYGCERIRWKMKRFLPEPVSHLQIRGIRPV